MKRFLTLSLSICLFGSCSDDSGSPGENNGGGSDENCRLVDGVILDLCADGQACVRTSDTTAECLETCSTSADCDGQQECYDVYRGGELVCGPPKPVCDAAAAQADCMCDFDDGTDSPVFLVTGTGADCTIVERNQTACYSEWFDQRACDEDPAVCSVGRFYRYELGDGNALVIRGNVSEITEGWTNQGSGSAPADCPVLGTEY